VGVLLTRGRPTIIYPETLLTFRLSAPLMISTEHVPQAFQTVGPGGYTGGYNGGFRGGYNGGYGGGPSAQGAPLPGSGGSGWNCLGYGWPAPPVANAPAPYYYPYPYAYWPSFSFWYGPGFYGRGYYGRGFYRR
jgi:hypothetical protein